MAVLIRSGVDGIVTLQLAGTLDMACVADIDRALQCARSTRNAVILDLGCVRLIDRPTLEYVMDVIRDNVQAVVNCPDHVRAWMGRARTMADG